MTNRYISYRLGESIPDDADASVDPEVIERFRADLTKVILNLDGQSWDEYTRFIDGMGVDPGIRDDLHFLFMFHVYDALVEQGLPALGYHNMLLLGVSHDTLEKLRNTVEGAPSPHWKAVHDTMPAEAYVAGR